VSDVNVALTFTVRFSNSIPAVSVSANWMGICCPATMAEVNIKRARSLNRNTLGFWFFGYIVQYNLNIKP
jgi:hypothetical protein